VRVLDKSEIRDLQEYTALIHSAKFGHVDCMRLLLDAGADAEAKDTVRLVAALSLCA
jgi:ankyrin repeat protein